MNTLVAHEAIIAGMTANSRIRAWLREQGEHVSDRGRISSADQEKYYAAHPSERPAGGVRLLPGPDDDIDAWEDLGVIGLDGPESDGEALGAPLAYEDPRTFSGDADGPPEAPPVDPEPAHARRDWRKGGKQTGRGGAKPRATRVTAGVRGDIEAKISFALMVPGTIWKARDQLCGGTFVDQIPATADAFTDIVCDSADLIAFFTGPGGNFMKALKVGAALLPVVQVIAAHHVYHTLEEGPVDAQQPDYGSYAA